MLRCVVAFQLVSLAYTYPTSTHLFLRDDPSSSSSSSRFPLPLVIFLVFAIALGIPLVVLSQRFARWTTSTAYGLSLAGIVWILIFNLVPNFMNADSSTQSSTPIPYANLLAVLLAILCFFFAYSLAHLRLHSGWARAGGMALMCSLGGMAFGLSFILVRSGLLVPTFFPANWILVGLTMVVFAGLLWRFPEFMMILSPVELGIFLLVVACYTAASSQQTFLVGLHLMFHMHSDSFLDVNYSPTILASLLSGLSPLISLIISVLFYRFAPPNFRTNWSWNTTSDRSSDSFVSSVDGRSRTSSKFKSRIFRPKSFNLAPSLPPLDEFNSKLNQRDKDQDLDVPYSPKSFYGDGPGRYTIYEAQGLKPPPLALPSLLPQALRPGANPESAAPRRAPLSFKIDKKMITLPTTYAPRSRFSRFSQDAMI